jgi:hypothetical protein
MFLFASSKPTSWLFSLAGNKIEPKLSCSIPWRILHFPNIILWKLLVGFHKSRSPGRHGYSVLYGSAYSLWVLCVKLATFKLDGPKIFKLYLIFVEHCCNRGLESAHNKTQICVLPYEERLASGLPALCFWKRKIYLDFHFAYPLQEREIRIYSRRALGCCDHSSCFIGIELTSVETKQEVQQCTNF